MNVFKQIANIPDLLDTQTSSQDAEKSNPYSDILQATVARLAVAPSECIVVGDSP